MKIKALIVDDEPPARERLATLLKTHAQIEIVGEAEDVQSAASLAASLQPDVIFLDIQLPRASGFELLPLLTGEPTIIFVTAYDRYAIRAFEVNAMDYLLKPIHPDRLAVSLQRLTNQAPEPDHTLTDLDLVVLKEDRLLRMVSPTEITLIKADDNYSIVHLLEKVPAYVRRSLAEWDKILPPGKFVRVDRSMIVRVDAIQSLRAESRDSAELLITGQNQPILLGRRAALLLRRIIEE